MTPASLPDWVPGMVPVDPWRSNTYDILYEVFTRDLLNRRLTYLGFHVWFYPHSDEDGRKEIFWHLTTRTDRREAPPVRFPDLRRSERLSWVRSLIERCRCPVGDVLDWDHLEGDGAIKTYVWLQNHDFVVIMKKLGDGQRRLITSYHLDGESQRVKMLKKWNRRIVETPVN